jgi:hypothetical protein
MSRCRGLCNEIVPVGSTASGGVYASGPVPAVSGTPNPPPIQQCVVLNTTTLTYEDQAENEFTITVLSQTSAELTALGYSIQTVVFSSGSYALLINTNLTDPGSCYTPLDIEGVVNGELTLIRFLQNA